MKNLYFQRASGDYLLIKENVPEEQALKEIKSFLSRHNYESYYTRYWIEDDIITYDVGSWTEFIVLAEESALNAKKIIGTEKDFIEKR